MACLSKQIFTKEGSLVIPKNFHYYLCSKIIINYSIVVCNSMRSLNGKVEDDHQEHHFEVLSSTEKPLFLRKQNKANNPAQQEINQCHNLIQRLNDSQNYKQGKIEQMIEFVEKNEFNKGIGFYNAKNMIFLEYTIHLHFYQLFKINGIDLTTGKGLELYQRLVYLKTVLLKLGPIEKKLEYQTNKILKYSDTANVQADKKRQVHSESENQQQNVQDNINKKDIQDEDEDVLSYQPGIKQLKKVQKQRETKKSNDSKYVPPKISSNLSKGDKQKQKLEQDKERRKKRLIRKFQGDLQEDDDRARQVGNEGQTSRKLKKMYEQQTSLQESMFTRFNKTREQRYKEKQIKSNQAKPKELIDEIKELDQIKQIFREEQEDAMAPIRKRQHTQSKPKAGHKKRKHE